MDEREQYMTQLISAWVAKLFSVSLAGEDEKLRDSMLTDPGGEAGRPNRAVLSNYQTLGYPEGTVTEISKAYPTEAKSREKESCTK